MLSLDIGTRNLGYSIIDKEQHIVLEYNLFDIQSELDKNKKDKRAVVIRRPIVIIDFLNKLVDEFKITDFVIEKQNINNPLAMNIQSTIITYALMKNITVISFDPKTKFDINNLMKLKLNLPIETIQQFTVYNSSVKEHKKKIVTICREVLKSQKEIVDLTEHFESFKKKDDISDSMIQGLISSYSK